MLNANLLRGAIARAGMNQYEFAAKLGITPNTLTTKLMGRTSFTLDEVDKTCEILAITDNSEKCDIFLSTLSLNRDVNESEETKNE
ncbi:MAG: helix-turn-helix domain-containing protein [Ruminococcus sp.]|nr:helix-turn-helix domain-containing protein [Ruminococcus sp.]